MATVSIQSEKTSSTSLKEKAKEEFKVFWVIAIYLALMFSAFFTYRRLTLHESGITYLHYGAGVIEALILAKVILIGRALGLGRRFEEKPLIVSVLFKAVIFGAFVGVFSVIEHVIDGLAHHETWDVIAQHLFSGGRDEIPREDARGDCHLHPILRLLGDRSSSGPRQVVRVVFPQANRVRPIPRV